MTEVYKKGKTVWLLISSVLLFVSCGERQATKSVTVEAQQTAGKIRQNWTTACRPLAITLEGMEAKLPDIGVYLHLADATDTERNAFHGVPFVYENGRYVAKRHHTVTADTLAVVYACFPYHRGLAADDSLVLAAPFGENLYGVETADISARRFPWKWIGAVRWCCSVSAARVTGCKNGWTDLRLWVKTFANGPPISLTWANGNL